MSAARSFVPRRDLAAQILATAALASWTVPLWCFRLRFGGASLARVVLPVLLGLGALSAILHLLRQRHAERFGIFFPATNEQRGSLQSIRLSAVLLLVFNLGAAGFMLHDSLAHTTLVLVILLSTVSAMNLADECWIVRRRRRNSRP